MKIHEHVDWGGCFTLAKFVLGRTTFQLEQILGFRSGRLSKGAFIGTLHRLPEPHEFELLGYSNVAEHHFKKPENLDILKLKKLARSTWSALGENQPVKIFPVSEKFSPDPDLEYPPGWGVPQWKLISLMKFEIVAYIEGNQVAKWAPIICLLFLRIHSCYACF